MKVLYVAGPYRSKLGIWGVKQNIEAAASVARDLWVFGYAVICPHMNTAFMDGAAIPDQCFLDGDIEILKRCDGIVMLTGWRESRGAQGEFHYAWANKIPVFYCDDMDYLARIEAHFRRKEKP